MDITYSAQPFNPSVSTNNVRASDPGVVLLPAAGPAPTNATYLDMHAGACAQDVVFFPHLCMQTLSCVQYFVSDSGKVACTGHYEVFTE